VNQRVSGTPIDPDTPCPFFTSPGTGAQMLWHISTETWVHRVDVDLARGRDIPPLTSDAGVDELRAAAMWRNLLGSLAADGPPDTIDCAATDSGVTVGSETAQLAQLSAVLVLTLLCGSGTGTTVFSMVMAML
jgi:hypothetical protein